MESSVIGPSRRRAVAAIAIAGAVMAMLGGCADAAAGARHGSSGGLSGGAHSVLSGEVVDYFFPATGAQVSVAAALYGTMTSITTGIVSSCLRHHGFQHEGLSATSAASTYFDNADFPDLAKMTRTGVFDSGFLSARQGPPVGLPAAEQKAFAAVNARCSVPAQKLFLPLNQAAEPLQSAWQNVIDEVETSTPVLVTLTAYESCMETAGVPAGSVSASSTNSAFGLFEAWETGAMTKARSSAGAMTVQRHWAPIFVRCATPTVAVQDPLMLDQQRIFLQQHYQQVLALETLASREVAAAQRQYGAADSG